MQQRQFLETANINESISKQLTGTTPATESIPRQSMPESIATEQLSDQESATSEIRQEVQKQMYLKARNYVGHNVLLKRGKIKIEKAKEKKDLAKYIKKDNKATPFARLEEYVSDVI